MKRLITLSSIFLLCLMLVGNVTTLSQQGSEADTEDALAAYQAIAEGYYEEGIDENFMLGDPLRMDHMWYYYDTSLISAGMFAPDFTLMAHDGTPHTLSDFQGEKFVVVVTGSWY